MVTGEDIQRFWPDLSLEEARRVVEAIERYVDKVPQALPPLPARVSAVVEPPAMTWVEDENEDCPAWFECMIKRGEREYRKQYLQEPDWETKEIEEEPGEATLRRYDYGPTTGRKLL